MDLCDRTEEINGFFDMLSQVMATLTHAMCVAAS
jgi:hypothetical protein